MLGWWVLVCVTCLCSGCIFWMFRSFCPRWNPVVQIWSSLAVLCPLWSVGLGSCRVHLGWCLCQLFDSFVSTGFIATSGLRPQVKIVTLVVVLFWSSYVVLSVLSGFHLSCLVWVWCYVGLSICLFVVLNYFRNLFHNNIFFYCGMNKEILQSEMDQFPYFDCGGRCLMGWRLSLVIW